MEHLQVDAMRAARLAALDALLRQICPRAPTDAEVAAIRAEDCETKGCPARAPRLFWED
jgi:hypothetical protein